MQLLKVRPTMHKRQNFTMVEILATIAIIAILAGLSFGAYRAIQKGQARTKTEATVNAIHIALQAFKNKYGYYPQSHKSTGTGTSPSATALVFCKEKTTTEKVSVPTNSKTILRSGSILVLGKDFTTFLGSQVMKNAATKDREITIGGETTNVYIFVDAYKDPVSNCGSTLDNINSDTNLRLYNNTANLIYYKCPGDMNQESYDLFSAGPDRKFNTNDDIWPQGLKRDTSNN